MVSAAQMRKLALALPGVEEKSHFGQPDFRVGGKIFAGMSPDGERGSFRMDPELQAMVLAAKPNVFSGAAGAWGQSGWTYVRLARVGLSEMEGLLLEAWRLIAPRRLVAAYAADPAGAAPLPATKKKKKKTGRTSPPRRR